MRDRKKRNIVIGSLCCLLVFMGIGYALLNQRLTIKGSELIMGEWDVRITNIVVKQEQNKGRDVAHSYTNTSATFEADLWIPGDLVEYEVTVENRGNVKAVLQNSSPATYASDKSVKFTHSQIPETLSPGDIKTFTMKVEFDDTASSIPENKTVKYTLDVTYVQNDGKSEVVKATESSDSSCFMISEFGTLLSYDQDCGENMVVPKEVNGIAIKDVLPSVTISDGVISILKKGKTDVSAYDSYVYIFINEDKKEEYFKYLDSDTNITDEQKDFIKSSSYIYNSDEYKSLEFGKSSALSSSKYNYKVYKYSDGTVNLDSAFNSTDANVLIDREIINSYYGELRGNYCKTAEACELLKEYFKSIDPAKDYSSNTNYEYIAYQKKDNNNGIQSMGAFYTIDELDKHYITLPGFYNRTYKLNTKIKTADFSNAIYIENFDILSGPMYSGIEEYSTVKKLILPPNPPTIMFIHDFDEVIFPKNSTTKAVKSIIAKKINIPASVTAIASYNSDVKLESLTFDEGSKLRAIYGSIDCYTAGDGSSIFTCGDSGFSSGNLTSLNIPSPVRYIGPAAFKANSIITLNLPSSIKYLGYSAFENNSITALNIPSNLQYLGDQSFKDNKISTLTFASDSNLRHIGGGGRYSNGNVFYGNQLTSVVLPSSIEEIDKDSFGNNSNLKQITLTGAKPITYFNRTLTELKLTDGYQLDVGTEGSPVYATVKYQK